MAPNFSQSNPAPASMMSPSVPTPVMEPGTAHEKVMREFFAMLKKCTVEGACGREFILPTTLTTWMRETSPGSRYTWTDRLLQSAYSKRSLPGRLIESDHIADGVQSALLTFCILLELGHGALIHTFHSHELVDRKIPIDLYSLRTKLGELDELPKPADELAIDFNEKQWRYCAATFDLRTGLNHVKHRILPICVKRRINKKGGTADLWYIEVHQEFVGERLREAVPDARFKPDGSAGELGYRYAFALKSFKEGYKEVYENEKEAWTALQRNEKMVKYLGHYGHKQSQKSESIDTPGGGKQEVTTTHNILLEYAECDLAEYFAEQLPPVFQTEIVSFWKALFEVADALERIHNLENEDGAVKKFDGWHADIKPDNILNIQGKFKLADPGFAKFVVKSKAEALEVIMGGTMTFGAPECHHRRRGTYMPVTQAIDVWSLGCVFSVTATWVTLGYQGLLQYAKLRQKAVKGTLQPSDPSQTTQKTGKVDNDYFHDGKTALSDVTSWHQVLRGALRKSDTITSRILDLVDEKMLLGTAQERIKAKDLCAELERITLASEAESRHDFPENVKGVLLEVDDTAPHKFEYPSSETIVGIGPSGTNQQDRPTRKSILLDRPLMKTAHRSEYHKSMLNTSKNRTLKADPVPELPANNSALLQPRYMAAHVSPPIAPHSTLDSIRELPAPSRTSTLQSLQLRNHRRSKSRVHVPQTIAQVQEEQKQHKSSLIERTFDSRRKDVFLTEFYDNRDIIFLVDNASSMAKFWPQVTEALDVLVKKVKGQDKDGVDLSFTCWRKKLTQQKGSSKINSVMQQAQPSGTMETNMGKALGDILSEYLNELAMTNSQKKKKWKGLTIIVLTDGIWDGMTDKNDVEEKVVNFLEQLGKITGHLKDRLASIEFIQFGDDPDATHRLQHLDGELKWQGVPDIIDTEHVSGDVYKMLLGSFVEGYDDEGENGSIAPNTPVTRPESVPITNRTQPPEEMSYTNGYVTGPYSPPRNEPTQSSAYSAAPRPPQYLGPKQNGQNYDPANYDRW